jgi:hypothetical protein
VKKQSFQETRIYDCSSLLIFKFKFIKKFYWIKNRPYQTADKYLEYKATFWEKKQSFQETII